MVYLINKESYANFIYNYQRKDFLREASAVAVWVGSSLRHEPLYVKNKKMLDQFRKLLRSIPVERLELMNKKEAEELLSTKYPEYFI